MEEKQQPRIENLEAKVYFLTYTQPRYVDEIGSMFYGEKRSYPQIAGAFNKLLEAGSVKKITDIKLIESLLSNEHKKKHKKKIDKRYIVNRSYYQATPKLLLEWIKNKLTDHPDKALSSNEEKILEYLFNHDSFRKFIGVILFKQEEGKEPVFLKEYATLDIITQFLAFLCSYMSVLLKTNGETIKDPLHGEFKIRFKNTLEKGRKIERKGIGAESEAFNKMYLEYQDRIEKKITSEMFYEHKTDFERAASNISDDRFIEALLMMGSSLLEKLAYISTLNDWIRLIHVSSATSSILQTYLYFNVDYPKEIGKKEIPALLTVVKPLLEKLQLEAKSKGIK